MIAARRMPVLFVVAASAAVLAGCETTQERSARITAELGPVKKEKGLVIDEESKDVEVLDTTLLTDPNGTAVVVEVKNTSDETLVDVPIGIDVLDAKGKSVYRNDLPGLEPALTSIPLLKAGETLDWVNNQVLPLGEPDDVKVEVGADAALLEGEIPDIEIGEPELKNDPVSGINATGAAINNTDEQHDRLVIFGVARSGGEIVAAGRAAVEKLNPERRRAYHVYFIGDPKGAELELTSFPTLATSQDKEGSDG